MNASNFTNVSEAFNGAESISSSRPELLAFAVYKMILSPVTVIGNGLLLITGFTDPLRSFRSPSSVFLLTMSAANFLTGMVVAPIFASLEYNAFFGRTSLDIAIVGSSFSLLSLNISFGMVFAMSFDTFIAVFRPTKYRRWITMQRAKICIAITCLIALTFAILPHLNIPIDTVLKFDMHFNSTLNSTLLVLSYVLLYAAFRNQTKKSVNLGTRNNFRAGKLPDLRNKFRTVLFSFVVVSTVPAILSTLSYHLEYYCVPCKRYKAIVIGQQICLNLMFMKCALDPFAFGWRLSRNRQALKKIICCQLRIMRQIGTTDYPDNLSLQCRRVLGAKEG